MNSVYAHLCDVKFTLSHGDLGPCFLANFREPDAYFFFVITKLVYAE